MSSSERKIILTSSDGESFEVPVPVAFEFQPVKDMMENNCIVNGIPLENVNGKTLAKVIDYCEKHVRYRTSAVHMNNAAAVEEELRAWDAEFVKLDNKTLFDLILAAKYLNIKGLLDLTCQTVADMIKGCTPEEIARTFKVNPNLTPEEEEEVRRENAWAFE